MKTCPSPALALSEGENALALTEAAVKYQVLLCRLLLERCILTEKAIPEVDAKLRWGPQSAMPDSVRNAAESGGYNKAVTRFRPISADIDNYREVASWIAWLNHEYSGDEYVRIIVARTFGFSYRQIGLKMQISLTRRFSRTTVSRYHSAAIIQVHSQFSDRVPILGDRLPQHVKNFS